MFLLRESPWWILISGAVGYFCGWGKGRAGLGLILGVLLGPLGCLAIMLLPPAPRGVPEAAGRGNASPGDGSACPRCGHPASRRARACAHCGNVLMPIRYAVESRE